MEQKNFKKAELLLAEKSRIEKFLKLKDYSDTKISFKNQGDEIHYTSNCYTVYGGPELYDTIIKIMEDRVNKIIAELKTL